MAVLEPHQAAAFAAGQDLTVKSAASGRGKLGPKGRLKNSILGMTFEKCEANIANIFLV